MFEAMLRSCRYGGDDGEKKTDCVVQQYGSSGRWSRNRLVPSSRIDRAGMSMDRNRAVSHSTLDTPIYLYPNHKKGYTYQGGGLEWFSDIQPKK